MKDNESTDNEMLKISEVIKHATAADWECVRKALKILKDGFNKTKVIKEEV